MQQDNLGLKERLCVELDKEHAKMLVEGIDLMFKGAIISPKNRAYSMIQNSYVNKLTDFDVNNSMNADYVAGRARSALITVICHRDEIHSFSIASQIMTYKRPVLKISTKSSQPH